MLQAKLVATYMLQAKLVAISTAVDAHWHNTEPHQEPSIYKGDGPTRI